MKGIVQVGNTWMDETNDALGVLHLKMWTKALAEMGPAMSRAISAMPVPVPVPRALSTLSLWKRCAVPQGRQEWNL